MRCFSSPGSPRIPMDSACDTVRRQWVAPFGNFRIKACSQLPGTYRNVLRPSSPLSAKASTKCPSLLDPTHTVQNTRNAQNTELTPHATRNPRLGTPHTQDQAHEDLEHSQFFTRTSKQSNPHPGPAPCSSRTRGPESPPPQTTRESQTTRRLAKPLHHQKNKRNIANS